MICCGLLSVGQMMSSPAVFVHLLSFFMVYSGFPVGVLQVQSLIKAREFLLLEFLCRDTLNFIRSDSLGKGS